MKTNKFYGQNGEDCVLWSIFDNSYIGTYLDVGALDGKRFSNSYSFELAGWNGVCAEAHPDYISVLRKNRPTATVIHAAVSAQDKDSTILFANKLGTLSTLDGSMEGYFKSAYPKAFYGYKKIPVPMRTVDSILEETGIYKVDVVSIDVEGTELDVLRGFTLCKYKPRILVLEAIDQNREIKLQRYLASADYLFARKTGNNVFYCKKEDVNAVKKAQIIPHKQLIHTDHPIKSGHIK